MEMINRPRRLRTSANLRKMVRETRMDKSSLIYPMFIVEGTNIKEEIPSMMGQYRYSVDRLPYELERLQNAGVNSIMLFGIPDHKDEVGSGAYDPNGIVQKALREAKKQFPDMYYITDVCMCEYTSHGHCGVLCGHDVNNDATLELLAKTAVSHVEAGADIIMLDNMTTEEMQEAIRIIDGRAETECSGNVTKENIARLTGLGVDYISSGALTHSSPILDISMKNLHPVKEDVR